MYVSEPRKVKKNMNARVKVLKELVADGHYVIDESVVADAMVLRSRAALLLPELTFRCTASEAPPAAKVRSFRPHRGARSFRLTRAKRRPVHAHSGVRQPAL
jgi:hypothetical protein